MKKEIKNKTLFLFTAEYPHGVYEAILGNEMPFASAHFENIYVLPHKSRELMSRNMPPNAHCIYINAHEQTRINLARHFFLIAGILLTEFKNTRNKRHFIKNTRLWVSYIKKALSTAKALEPLIASHQKNNIHFYSYWMNDWALALAILKKQGKINGFVFRCGGFDIWDDRHPGNYLPFRYFIYRHTDWIFPNSKQAESYLKAFNFYSNKIKLASLGTPDWGMGSLVFSDYLLIVSCSSLIPLKRVHLIVQELLQVVVPVKWIHFGDGPEMARIKDAIKKLPAHITVEMKGNVGNHEIHKFYKEQAVDFFITVSETESLPVSIQEAQSYGIPVMATNVGGISEIVNEQTGYLFQSDFKTGEIAVKLNTTTGEWRTENRRKVIRKFWDNYFNAQKIYSDFYNEFF